MRSRSLLPMLIAAILMALLATPTAQAICPNPEGCCNHNGTCDFWEDAYCPDCDPPPPTCGDGTCNGAETCGSCVQDCGACAPDCDFNGHCDAGESCASCPADCDPPPAFSLSTYTAAAGQSITFTGIDIDDPAPSWDLGNGTHVVGNPIDYAYSTPGPAMARLTATDTRCNTTQVSNWQHLQITDPVCNHNRTCEPHLGESCGTCAHDCGARPAFSVSDDSPFVDQPVDFVITNPEDLVTGAPITWHYGDGARCDNCSTSSSHDYAQPGVALASVVATEARCGSVQSSGPVAIHVLPASSSPHLARYVSQSVPAQLHPGQTVEVRITMRNAGSSDWSDAQDYFLGSANPLNGWTWGLNRVSIGGVVGYQDEKQFVFTITAPTTPGYYNFQWRMLQEHVEWFGDSSPNVAIRVGDTDGDDAAFRDDDVPDMLAGGELFTAHIEVANTGTSNWSRDGGGPADGSQGYKLAVLSGKLLTVGDRYLLGPEDVVPQGGTHVFEVPIRMPLLGHATAELQMVHEGSGYFGDVLRLNVTLDDAFQLVPISVDPDHGSAGTVVTVDALQGSPFHQNVQARFSFGDPKGHVYSRIPVTTAWLSGSRLQFTVPPEAVDCGAHYITVTSAHKPLSVSKKFKLQSPCDETRRGSFDVQTYNTHLLPFPLDAWLHHNTERRLAMIEHPDLRGHDALILVETMDDFNRQELKFGLRLEYPYQTKVLAHDGDFCGPIPIPFLPIKQDGGVVILSKWPIEGSQEYVFDNTSGWVDECARKGVLYARINKAGRRYNLFGTHLDANILSDPEHDRIARLLQLAEFSDFWYSLHLSPGEPALFGGDFNIDESDAPADYHAMLTLLRATAPPILGIPSTNTDGDWIDYVLSSDRNLHPTQTSTPPTPSNEAYRVEHPWPLLYLSDHFAVLGRFRYLGSAPPAADCEAPPSSAPLLAGPSGTIDSPTPTLTWTEVPQASSFTVRVSRPDGGQTVLQESGIAGSSYRVQVPLPNDTPLEWSVWGVNECGAGPTSQVAALEVRRQPTSAPIQVPRLYWPAGAFADPRPTFRSSAVEGASSYTVFATRDDDGSVVFQQSGVASPSFTPASTLPLHTPLHWGVVSHNPWGDGPSSELIGFSIDPGLLPVPDAPAPTTAAGCTTSPRPTLHWSASSGAITYWVAVTDLSDGSSLVDAPGLYHTSFSPNRDLPAGRPLAWRVRACTYTDCSAWSQPREFMAACSATSAPEPLSPQGCIQAAQPTLTWTAVPDASQYALEVFRAFDGSPVHAATVTGTAVTMPMALSAWTEYWFRVRTVTAGGGGTWSRPRYFSVHCMPEWPGTASPIAPAQGSSIGSLPLFRWEQAPNTTEYYVEVSREGTVSRGAWYSASGHCADDRCAATPHEALALGAHTWRVRTRNPSGDGPWSPSVSFVVSGLSASPWNAVAVADFNLDGDLDILWQHQSTGDLEIWAMNGTSRTQVLSPSPSNFGDPDWEVAAVADLNKDQSPDILWQRRQTSELVVWFMDGLLRSDVRSPYPNRPSSDVSDWKVVASADYNGDQQPDLLWQHRTAGYLVAWVLDGIVKSETLFPSPNRPSDDFANWKVAVTDALAPSRSATQQWVWQQQLEGWLVVWNMTGVVKLSTDFPIPNRPDTDPGRWKLVGSGDFSGDGAVDLLFRNQELAATAVWIMNGTARTGTVGLPAR